MRQSTVLYYTVLSCSLIASIAIPGTAVCQSSQEVEISGAQVSLIQNTFVATPIAGIVSQVHVVEGDHVRLENRLVQLDTEHALTELEAAQAAHHAAKLRSDNDVGVRYARRTTEVRQREVEQSHEANQLYPGTVSESEIIKQQLQVDQAELAIEQAEHDHQIAIANVREKQAAIMIAQAQLRRHGVIAPVSGDVVEVAVTPGEWVDRGEPLVRIVSLDPIRVECFIDGRSLGDELVGRAVDFFPDSAPVTDTSSAEATALRGYVTFVSPELHPVTGQARLWATIANPDRVVQAGMHGRLVVFPSKDGGSPGDTK